MTKNFDSLDWTVPVKKLAKNGISLSYEASDTEIEVIREAYDLHAAHLFRLEVDLRQGQQGIITVKGRLAVSVEQKCVVTLLPVAEKMDFDFDRLFVRDRDNNKRKNKKDKQRRDDGVEVVIEPLDDDPPDILTGNSIDIGKMALEEFSLGLNPYPRHSTAPGTAEFSFPGTTTADDTSDADVRPFAVLKSIQASDSSE